VPGYDAPHATPEGWKLTAARGEALSTKGWPIALTAAGATAEPPSFAIDAKVAPWLRLNWWASGLERANGYVEWTTRDAPQFSLDRRVYFSAAGAGQTQAVTPQAAAPRDFLRPRSGVQWDSRKRPLVTKAIRGLTRHGRTGAWISLVTLRPRRARLRFSRRLQSIRVEKP
jgi:hypothetical protein